MEEFVRSFFIDYGLLALFVLMLLDNIGVPFPSEIPLLLAGFFVSDGRMDYVPAVIVSALGSLAGAWILYVLGRTIGRAIVLRWGRVIRISHDDIDRAEAWFHQRGEASVFFLRVVPLARTIISIPAGMLEMHPFRFSAYTFTGSLLWTIAVIGAGWGLGARYEDVIDGFGLASLAAAGFIGMVALAWVAKRLLDRRPPAPPLPESPPQAAPPDRTAADPGSPASPPTAREEPDR